MVSLSVLASFAGLALVGAELAPQSNDSPSNILYKADFYDTLLIGTIAFWAVGGTVVVGVGLGGIAEGGPFDYEVAQQNIPPRGSCPDAGETLNPYHGTLDAPTWAEDAVGDLSGKHGKLTTGFYSKVYLDQYLSLNPKNEAFVGDKAVVIYKRDGTILSCGNLKPIRLSGETVAANGQQVPKEYIELLPKNVTESSVKVAMPLAAGARAV